MVLRWRMVRHTPASRQRDRQQKDVMKRVELVWRCLACRAVHFVRQNALADRRSYVVGVRVFVGSFGAS